MPAHESIADLAEGWGDPVDRREYLLDSPGFDRRCDQRTSPADRAGGRNAPHFETEADLARMRGVGRWLAATDETSIGILANLANYVVGTGFTYIAAPRRRGAAPAELLAAVQDAIDEFAEDNQWRRVEREAFLRSRRDGEFFLRLLPGSGRPRLAFIEPDHVARPRDARLADELVGAFALDWEFGVATDQGEAERIHGYHVDYSGDGRDWEFLPPHLVEHARLNVDSGVKRGMSDFYAAASEIEQAAKLAHNTAEGAAIQATIAYIKEAPEGTGQAAIEAQRQSRTDWTATVPIPDGGARTLRFERFRPRRVITTAGMKYHAGPLGASNAPTFIEVVQMVLRRIGQRWSMPEYLVSGDASNANYASTLVAESPFVKAAEAQQAFYAETFRELFWKALRIAHAHGRLRAAGLEFPPLRRLVRINVQPPRVSVRDRREETDIRRTLHEAGLLSRRTWAALEDLDWEAEREQLLREQAQNPIKPSFANNTRRSPMETVPPQ